MAEMPFMSMHLTGAPVSVPIANDTTLCPTNDEVGDEERGGTGMLWKEPGEVEVGGGKLIAGDEGEDRLGEILEDEEIREEWPFDKELARIWAALARIKSVSIRLTLSAKRRCSAGDPGRKKVPQISVVGALR
jgi:hypothetical protein